MSHTRIDKPVRGRGVSENPAGRFEPLRYEIDRDGVDDLADDATAPATEYFRDDSRSIISYNNSPDIGFDAGINPYRGCSHGCSYCYARPYHEYLGFSAGLDFETRIIVKENAPALLRRELASPRWKPQPLAMSGVTDCYQPIERDLKITRGCLAVLAECRNPVAIVTKNRLVTRDLDLLQELARHQAALVCVSVTTLDDDLVRVLEPRTARPRARLDVISKLSAAGIPTTVLISPVIPGLTDHELADIIKAAARAGAQRAHFVPLRLPGAVEQLFVHWLEQHFPRRKEKVLALQREIRGGELDDPKFGTRLRGQGNYVEQLRRLFQATCRKAGINQEPIELSTAQFRRPRTEQLELWSGPACDSPPAVP